MKLAEMKGITKIYANQAGQSRTVLDDLDLMIYEGDMVAIMGSSGCGKSTLLHILGCLDEQTSGTYMFKNDDVREMSWDEKAVLRNREIGFVLQDFGLIEYKTVLDNVAIPLRFNSQIPGNKVKTLCMAAIREVGLDGYATELVRKLSGGEKQRVAIARAIVNHPSLILADEPTGALDEENSVKIMELFQRLNEQGMTIVVVTHDPVVANTCKKTYKLHNKCLVEA